MKVTNITDEHVNVTMSVAEWACIRHYAHYYAALNGPWRADELAAMKLGRCIDDTDLLFEADKLFNFEK